MNALVGGEDGNFGPEIEYHEKVNDYRRPIARSACDDTLVRLHRRYGLSQNHSYFLVSVHPTASVRVSDIDAILSRWEIERNFVPDVIIVDYADILAPENSRLQLRDQMNETWASLRRLSQERRCLVLVPTQASAKSYQKSLQTMTEFSEDKRKMAHVTGMLGLNQTEQEKPLGIMRLNWIVLRESPYSVRQCLFVAQCLALGRAMCCAYLKGSGNDST